MAGVAALLCLSTLATVATAEPTRGQEETDVAAALDRYLTAAAELHRFSGSVLVAVRGREVFAKGYGLADAEMGKRNNANTSMRVGSVTKTLVAVALFRLAERRRIALERSVCRYLEPCPRAWTAITPQMLLEHTAGLSSALDDTNWTKQARVSLEAAVRQVERLPLQFRPGTRWSYCNACYLVAGLLIERITGETWPRHLQRTIFRPLGMTATGYAMTGSTVGYTSDREGRRVRAPYEALADRDSAGGLRTSVRDLFRFDQALYSGRLLSRRSLRRMFAPSAASHGEWSAGWEIGTRQGVPVVRHSGFVAGWAAMFSRYGNNRATIIVSSNRSDTPVDRFAHDVVSIVFGWPYEVPRRPTTLPPEPSALTAFVGRYATHDRRPFRLQVRLVVDALVLHPGPQRGGDPLWQTGPLSFVDSVDPRWRITFTLGDGRSASLLMRNTKRGGSLRAYREGGLR